MAEDQGQVTPTVHHQNPTAAHDVDSQSSLSSDETQTGVKNIELMLGEDDPRAHVSSPVFVSSTPVSPKASPPSSGISKGVFCILLVAFCTSLESLTTSNLTVYATSAFAKYSLVATVLVVQQVVNAVMKPPMAKIANVCGRLEAFSIGVFLYVIGYIQMAGSDSVKTFASAQIFYSAGSTASQILIQIFIADTTDSLNRALFSSLPDVPFLITVWSYGIWTSILPVAFTPLALMLFLNMRKAARLQLLPPSPWAGQSVVGGLRSLWYELDIMGLLLLSAAISLILVPCTLAATAKSGWHNASIIAMFVIGCVCLIIFPFWELTYQLAPRPFPFLRLVTDRTVLAGCAIGFFYFAVFYTSVQPYFSSYLQVVQGDSVTAAGHIVNTFSFSSTVTSIGISFVIKYTRRYKYYITAGACIYLLGIGLMVRYRSESSSASQIVGTQIAVGIGGGMLNVPAQLGVQAAVSHGDVAAVTAMFLAVVEIGDAVEAAISGTVWTANLPTKLAQYLPAADQADATMIFGNLTLAKSYMGGTPQKAAINRSYQETMNVLLIIAACLLAPFIPLSLLMKNYKLDSIGQKAKWVVIGQERHLSEGTPEATVDEGKGRKNGLWRV